VEVGTKVNENVLKFSCR